MSFKKAQKELNKHLRSGYKGANDRKVAGRVIPLGDRFYIRQFQENNTSAVVIPSRAEQDKKSQGVVEEIGTGDKIQDFCKKHDLKVGDHVVYQLYSGDTIVEDKDKEERRVIDYDLILAKIV